MRYMFGENLTFRFISLTLIPLLSYCIVVYEQQPTISHSQKVMPSPTRSWHISFDNLEMVYRGDFT
jgi:hypothetical protein